MGATVKIPGETTKFAKLGACIMLLVSEVDREEVWVQLVTGSPQLGVWTVLITKLKAEVIGTAVMS